MIGSVPRPTKWPAPFSVTIFLISIALTLFAADDLENRVREISDELRCPTCQAQSVKDSDAGLSLNMKNKIREMLKEGKSEEEILQFFVDRYGEWILRSPKKEGFNLLLWLLPAFLLLVVGALLVRSMLKRKQETTGQASPLSEQERKQVEKDLETFDAD